MSGYIKLHRGIADNPIWTREPFSSGQAWVDLLLAANFKDTVIYIRKSKVRLERGQLAWSQLTMAKRWKWSRNRVARFLKDLEEEGMIEQQSGHLTTITTICNYSKYQAFDTAGEAPDEAPSGATGGATGGAQYKKVNKGKKEKNNTGGSALDLSNLPDGVSEELALDFIEHRRKKKSPLTQRALNLCMDAAAKAPDHGLTPEQVIDEAIARGWLKPEPEWAAKSLGSQTKSSNVTPIKRKDGAVMDENGEIKGWWMFGDFHPNPEYRRSA